MAVTELTADHLIAVNRTGPSVPDSVIAGAIASAVALVDAYADAAPPGVKTEAAARAGSFLLDMRGASLDGRTQGGILRKSGAMSLLEPWHQRRAYRAD